MMAQMMQNHPQVCLLGLEKLKLHSTQFTFTKSQILSNTGLFFDQKQLMMKISPLNDP